MCDIQNKIDKLKNILEASKILNSTRNTEDILNFLLKKSIELIDGGDIGVIFIYNRESKMLEINSFVGFEGTISQIKLTPKESMTGMAFSTQKTIFYSDSKKICQVMKSMRDENKSTLERSLKKNIDKVHGSICCPLMYKDECIGVIVIDNFENDAPLTHDDVSLLEAISVQATIAIINARNYEKELRNKEVLEEYSKMVEEERNKYRYSTSLHNKFTDMVLNGNHIDDILAEVSSMLQRDVFMIDFFYNISNDSLSYYTNLEEIKEISCNFIKELNNSKKSRYFLPDKNLCFYFLPIIVNINNLGWLCIVGQNDFYSDLDNITLERATTILALELFRKSELNSMEQALKGDFLDNLILNQDKEYIMKYAEEYRFDLDKSHQIIIFEINRDKEFFEEQDIENEMIKYIKYYYNIISREIVENFSNAITLIKGYNIIVILEVTNNSNKEEIKNFLDNMIYIKSSHIFNVYKKYRVIAGVSDRICNIEDFKTSYYNTLQVMKNARKMKKGNIYLFYDDLEIKKFLLNTDKEDLESFLLKTLGPLIGYQKNSKNEFLNTLKIYIESNGNWTYTKNHLHIHGNTLSYRLNRIMDLLGVDLNHYHDRLKIQMAFEILDILSI